MLQKPLSIEEIAESQKNENTCFHRSRFKFLQRHFGIRPGRSHGILGTTGCGKSSLVKAMIADTALRSKVLVILSEETREDYQLAMNKIIKNPVIYNNILFLELTKVPENIQSQSDFLEYIDQAIIASKAEVVFIDNITTSSFYNDSLGPAGQQKAARYIQQTPKKLNIAIVYVAHTEKGITDNSNRLIAPENIRGNAMLPNLTEYFYIMQKYTAGPIQHNILCVRKYRHHEAARGFYKLYYSHGFFVNDEELSFDTIKEIYKGRDKLGF